MTVRGLAWLLAATVALSGCTDGDTGPGQDPVVDETGDPGPDEPMSIDGIVLDDRFDPIVGATIRLSPGNATTISDEEGKFAFRDLPRVGYRAEATAEGFSSQTLVITPRDTSNTIAFSLGPAAAAPYQESFRFRGFIECAAEAFIISPSCDSLVAFANGQVGDGSGPFPIPFVTNSTFDFDTSKNWKTVIADVVFDASDHPGIDGLRASALGLRAVNELTTYEKYVDAHDTKSFTLRLDAGVTYDEGIPVPETGTSLRIEVYPQSHGYYATCDLVCMLGVGTAVNVSFEVLVTTFYMEAAPEGWTLL